MEEKKSFEKKDSKALFPVETLIERMKKPTWQNIAFTQFSGWIKGKSVSEKEFSDKWKEFEKKYLGGS